MNYIQTECVSRRFGEATVFMEFCRIHKNKKNDLGINVRQRRVSGCSDRKKDEIEFYDLFRFLCALSSPYLRIDYGRELIGKLTSNY